MAVCVAFLVGLIVKIVLEVIFGLIVYFLWQGLTYLLTPTRILPTPIPEINYRLPLNIKPINYRIDIIAKLTKSDTEKLTFKGECKIEIQALQNTNQIQLHIRNLNVTFSRYYKKNDIRKTDLPKATPNSTTDIVVYNLNEVLQANVSYFLEFFYVGSINEWTGGFYRSKYKTKNATKSLYAAQFEAIHARRIFPSFVEPGFKATFELSITYDRPFQCVGPTAVFKEDNRVFHKKIYFIVTPIMPTYLLTFTVSELNVRNESQLAVFTRPEDSSQAEYSYECGKNLLAAFRSYFNTNLSTITEYSIHLDAVTKYELIEPSILYDKKESTLKSKQDVAEMVASEVAHLWWGKLVTCKWWGYIWLNKGFISYFKYYGIDLVDSSFDMSSQFVLDVVQNVMNDDATIDTSPMSNENVPTKEDISYMFNRISYLKAAAFIRMTKHILREHYFKTALKIYLTTHAYKSTAPSDLFSIWEMYWPLKHQRFSQKYFKSFTNQVGYPVVTFSRTSHNTVEVSQKRFLLKDFDKANTTLIYTVPITYTTSLKNNFKSTFPKFFLEDKTFTLCVKSNVSWIIGNIQETGFYRVNYDKITWNEIGKKLFSESREDIHVLNRVQIVDDLLNLARAGEIDYIVALNILKYLKNETKYLPLAAAFKGFSYLMTRLGNESNIFVPFIREIIQNNYHIVGFKPTKNETTLEIYSRTSILDWSCRNIIPDCVDQAKAHFDEISKNRSVLVNIRSVVLCTVMRDGNETNFNILYNKYMAETVSREKGLILDSLSCVKDRRLVDRFFQIIISSDLHDVDKTIALYKLFTKNNENVNLALDLIGNNIEQVAYATTGYHTVASIVWKIADHFTTKEQLQKLKDFNKKHTGKFGSFISTLQRAVSIVEVNLKWSRENLEKIKSILAKIAPTKS